MSSPIDFLLRLRAMAAVAEVLYHDRVEDVNRFIRSAVDEAEGHVAQRGVQGECPLFTVTFTCRKTSPHLSHIWRQTHIARAHDCPFGPHKSASQIRTVGDGQRPP
eukprot:GEMP01122148.1.p2 GENE.GEMP01122148.1~~GEMP01122148.1.p2  ORF type:complete len:106 (-),score=22.54 GEMP01122148.1:218-535(-)